ncbi:MAG: FISUMP domain-containing protein [Flavobacterium sp.]|uniref:FISUMP domain-containing protein n=1 Tax=Flavobacterium sp. TaxID=239 RepID=UPI003BD85654
MKKILLSIFALVLCNQTTYGQEVTIGTQIWQTTNLNVTTYSDGTPIPQVTDRNEWANLTTGAWCYYNNDSANGAVYGKLYNWYAAAGIYDATSAANPALRKKLAPTGWHVPTDEEWLTLITFLDPLSNGGSTFVGGALKQTGTSLWTSPNTGATNSTGFTALPGGYRYYTNGALFNSVGDVGSWWNSSEPNSASGIYIFMYYSNGSIDRTGNNKRNGCSVRCLSDNSLSNTTFDKSNIELYPNPVLNVLNVKVYDNLINQPYSIVDGLGRVVLSGNLEEVETTINVEQLSKGIYYLKVSDNSASKFIKE